MVFATQVRAAIGKMQLSTKKALLYYYCYFNIKLLKNNPSTAGRQTGQGCGIPEKWRGGVRGVEKRVDWLAHGVGLQARTWANAGRCNPFFLRQCPVLLLKMS